MLSHFSLSSPLTHQKNVNPACPVFNYFYVGVSWPVGENTSEVLPAALSA